MHNSRIPLLSWAALFAAVCAWGAVGVFAWAISAEMEARASGDVFSEQASMKLEVALRVHTLARETKDTRARLDALAHLDVFGIVGSIEAAGKDAKVEVEIGQALSASGADTASPVHTLGVIVEARGSFAALMHAAALLGSLPIPSAVERLQFERITDSPNSTGLWRLTARMRVLTTSDISS